MNGLNPVTPESVIEIPESVIEAFNSVVETVTSDIENLKSVIKRLVQWLRPVLNWFFECYYRACGNNPRIVYLAFHSRKRRVRKKNYNRLKKELFSYGN